MKKLLLNLMLSSLLVLGWSATLYLGGLQTVQAQTTYTAGATLVADEAGDRGNDVVATTSDGIWSFGTKTSSTAGWVLMPSTWHVDSFGANVGTVANAFAGWSEDNCVNGDCVPLIAVNTTLVDQGWVGGTTFAPATLWVHPNQTGTAPGACVAVRWTAPVDGTADVSAVWEGKYNGCSDGVSTHVTQNNSLLAGSQIDGAIPTLNTPLPYTSNGVAVLAGDTIDFATCPLASYICDSTQFDAMVTLTTVDDDGDGVPNDLDICPGGDDNVNTDGDLAPDFCDACPNDGLNDVDGDGVCGDVDVCLIGDDNLDADADDTPDACDACPLDADNDVDGDGICGEVDNCPIIANGNQADTDGDNVGDACDLDADNDDICDGSDAVGGICDAGPDNCSLVANNDQTDFDGDGAGDVCDSDDDNDSVIDSADSCLMTITGEVVDAGGCSVSDLCPCDNNWKNHGAYVRCVAHTSEDFVDDGLITEEEKDTIVSTAGMSSCGHKK